MWLDCRDVDSSVASLAGAIGITPAELEEALLEHDEFKFATPGEEDPRVAAPREFLALFDVDIEIVAEGFDGAVYFHGTRAFAPTVFHQRGILPLDQIVEELWTRLRGLAGDDVSDDEWTSFRSSVVDGDAGDHDGHLYRSKTGSRLHFGPNALLVREIHLRRLTGTHDYSAAPRSCRTSLAASVPLTRSTSSSGSAMRPRRASCASGVRRFGRARSLPRSGYLDSMLRDGEIDTNAAWSFDGDGVPVSADDVVDVETL